MAKIRIDHLPLDRQAAGLGRKSLQGEQGFFGGSAISSLYERRDIDPEATHLKRRHGSLRSTNAVPNILGVAADIDAGLVRVDHDFVLDIGSSGTSTYAWTAFATVRTPTNTDSAAAPIFSFNGVYVYIEYAAPANTVVLSAFDASGTRIGSAHTLGDLDTDGTDYRIAVRRFFSGTSKIGLNGWKVPASGAAPSIGTETAATYSSDGTYSLSLIGAPITAGVLTARPTYDGVVLTNFQFWDESTFSQTGATPEYETLAGSLTPADPGGTAKLLWHETFKDGGDIHKFTHTGGGVRRAYLVPTVPSDGGDTAPDRIYFGGKGTVEVPFYLDFDEYYWTPVNTSARLDWVFQIEVTLPQVLGEETIFDYQDILKLRTYKSGSSYYFKAYYSDAKTVADTTTALVGGATYSVYAGRDSTYLNLKVGSATPTTAVAGNPEIFNYDKTLGFVIGDTADQQNSEPFTGAIHRFAFTNDAAQKWHPLIDAVFYYDINSLSGDQFIDRGSRALNAYLGTRINSAPPFYREGGFPGGSYVAATGGYTFSTGSPGAAYSGELRKVLGKDAVVQRRGDKAFLTSNGVNYVIDDTDKTFRALGIPRPATKVSVTPQGIGTIDGFVRYAYRWVTKDGTVGPAFSLDPIDATGGVNVFLGAEVFGLPGSTPFSISFGRCEGTNQSKGNPPSPIGSGSGTGTVEGFVFRDSDTAVGGNPGSAATAKHNLLRRTIKNPGLTLEFATRIPNLGRITESVFSQGVAALNSVTGANTGWMCDMPSYSFPWIGQASSEWTIQFCFRYYHNSSDDDYQCLFAVGNRDQHYTTGWAFSQSNHYRCQPLVVSIQPPMDTSANTHSIVVCRDDPLASKKRNNALAVFSWDYNFVHGRDYCVVVRRGGSNQGDPSINHGDALIVNIYDHNAEQASAGTGWKQWPGSTSTERVVKTWFSKYSSTQRSEVMWGAGRHEGSNLLVKTRLRSGATTSSFGSFGYLKPISGGSSSSSAPGTILYHARMWRKDITQPVMAARGLERYAGFTQPLLSELEVDLAFCSDSSEPLTDYGICVINNDLSCPFYVQTNPKNGSKVSAYSVLTGSVTDTPLLTYGYDMICSSSTGPFNVTSLDDVALWVNWTSRNEGSITVGVGKKTLVEIAKRKWWSGATVTTFDDLGGTIDFTQWTWITLYYSHQKRPNVGTNIFDVWLERVFFDGNTGSWGEVYDADLSTGGINENNHTGLNSKANQGLFILGGLGGAKQEYQTEFAELRVWDGEYYTAPGIPSGAGGKNTFGPYLSSRLPPNIWDKLWYYARFTEDDVNSVASPTDMDHFGKMKVPAGITHTGAQQNGLKSVSVVRGASIEDTSTASTSPGSSFFTPFPTPPSSSIRGIQIFRTQVAPVVSYFTNGAANPNAISDAWRACRSAPLYYLTEIPRGTTFHQDTAPDTALGTQLDLTTGLLPSNPRGVFEWGGSLGIYVDNKPRIHFAESSSSWESFPTALVYDLPVREYGQIEAAVELASRDARNSRVLCLGKSWGAFIDGSPTSPQCNTLGGGVGAASQRCLVVEKGIAYAYNGTLWAITGDGQVEDIGLPVLDLLPDPDSARLSASSALGSLFVIDEVTGLALRFHFAKREWYVEDRGAVSVTDIDGKDSWVGISGYPSTGDKTTYKDDVETDTLTVTSVDTYTQGQPAGGDTVTLGSTTGLKVGQRLTLVADRLSSGNHTKDPRERQTVTIKSISGDVVTLEEDLTINATTTANLSGESKNLAYNAYPGVGYWGTMLDTGQFKLEGDLDYVDFGTISSETWWAAFTASDFAGDPASRSGLSSGESEPTAISDSGGQGVRWGLSNRQRVERLLAWTPEGSAVGLSEMELSYTENS